MPVVVAVNVVPDPKVVDVPLAFVPCQYHVVPEGGVPVLVIVTEEHWGELLVGLFGGVAIFTVTVVEAQLLLH